MNGRVHACTGIYVHLKDKHFASLALPYLAISAELSALLKQFTCIYVCVFASVCNLFYNVQSETLLHASPLRVLPSIARRESAKTRL